MATYTASNAASNSLEDAQQQVQQLARQVEQLVAQVQQLREHEEWSNKLIPELLKKVCDKDKPLLEENKQLKEQLEQVR